MILSPIENCFWDWRRKLFKSGTFFNSSSVKLWLVIVVVVTSAVPLIPNKSSSLYQEYSGKSWISPALVKVFELFLYVN